MKIYITILFTSIVFTLPSLAQDRKYVEDEELQAELVSREGDIARTAARIQTLEQKEIKASFELYHARREARRAEKSAVARARIFYRMSRRGGSLRYLLDSSTAIQFLKRLARLKHMLVESLEARNRTGLRVAELEQFLGTIREEKHSANQMLTMLRQELNDLQVEQRRRTAQENSQRRFAINLSQ